MAEFKVDEFANDLDIDVLEGLNKNHFILSGKHLGFSVKRAQRKNKIVSIIFQKYVDEGTFQDLDDTMSTDSVINFDLQSKRLEFEDKRKDRELETENLQASEREIQARERELQMQQQRRTGKGTDTATVWVRQVKITSTIR